MFDKLKKWAKETFLNAETLLGAPTYFGVGLTLVIFQEHFFTVAGLVLMGYAVYVFFVNRIKQEKKKKELIGK